MSFGQLPSPKQILYNFAALFSGMGLARVSCGGVDPVSGKSARAATGSTWPAFAGQADVGLLFVGVRRLALLWRGGRAENLETVAINSGVALTWAHAGGLLVRAAPAR
ncbi:MAG: hypothetical protein R2873_20185 [Caldilineaceae bacterium]